MSTYPSQHNVQYACDINASDANLATDIVPEDGPVVDVNSPSNDPIDIWQHTTGRHMDFVAWLASQCTLSPAVGPPRRDVVVVDGRGHQTGGNASTAVHATSDDDETDSINSDSLPPLTRDNSNVSSPTLDTDMASIVEGGFLLEHQDGILTVRHPQPNPSGDLLCPFPVLDCDQRMTTVVEFKMHVFSHFCGCPLPSYAPCFLCNDVFFQNPLDDPSMAWNEMLAHMVHGHFRAGQETAMFRPPLAVMRYLWNKDVITDAQFTRCQLAAPLTALDAGPGSRNSSPVPEAPVAPISATPPLSVRSYWRQSLGDQSEAFVDVARSLRGRRPRQSRPYLSPVRVHG